MVTEWPSFSSINPSFQCSKLEVSKAPNHSPVQDRLVGRGVEVHRGVRVRRLQNMDGQSSDKYVVDITLNTA